MKPLLYTSLLLLSTFATRAQSFRFQGGGEYAVTSPCVSPAQLQTIERTLQTRVAQLRKQGKLAPALRQATAAATQFAWPMRQAEGFHYPSYYGISNYVDLHADATLGDWNCQQRTYEGHQGTDYFLWPFNMNMMADEQVEVVAAAAGVVVEKHDGEFDQSCDTSSASGLPNYVILMHEDGTYSFYLHLKKNSVTPKPVGANVASGEFIGYVGSSGYSTGPHLHFEVRDPELNTLDPYQGTCNNRPSMWVEQKPYYDSRINALMTHRAVMQFNPCPQLHEMHVQDQFMPGDTFYFAAYYHDQRQGQVTRFRLFDPNGNVATDWTMNLDQPHYVASYWYWQFFLSPEALPGTWHFEAIYEDEVTTHTIQVGAPTAAAGNQYAQQRVRLFPNPTADQFTVSAQAPIQHVVVYNVLGAAERTLPGAGQREIRVGALRKGIYFVKIWFEDGRYLARKMVVE
ncbi:Por secretion system C-terminal sorting domain-containing protein [Catalinimonas alkaloidigena]|uniref:Por secretion system C-terminal sorting domain-containing protein n=1 Tax=Catalinimonas alkaloidigena TaxID=1075417 RepID=A0A1G8WS45_9BACT|nr:peptidoglycan DD-metalloendopeptidase family protein [Catalinimonas alkaloidigena]SDJ80867.1 Por secretion system C-terminal sorting domain-containing protein [Catalinimonas alkaloidigena]